MGDKDKKKKRGRFDSAREMERNGCQVWVTDMKYSSGYENIGGQNQMGCSRKIFLQALKRKKETNKQRTKEMD